MKTKKKRIVITGGHHNSALVVAEELRRRNYEIIWFGHKYTMWGDRESGAEFKEVTALGFPFVEIKAGKLGRPYRLKRLLRFPWGFVQSFYYLLKFRPALVLSFGGYLAVPVVVCAWFLQIPVATHEQTVVYGWANRFIAHFSKKIFVSWQTSLKHFPRHKVVHTGLPLRRQLVFPKKSDPLFPEKLPTLYITGGKQGAGVINKAVEEALFELLEKFNLIHQCGSSTVSRDFERLSKMKSQLPRRLQKRYFLNDYIFLNNIGRVFSNCDLAVGRSGAHFVYEIAFLGKPAIFIPIPWSRAQEQTKNAKMIAATGLAEIIPQDELTGVILYQKIINMIQNLKSYQRQAPKSQKIIKTDATKKIADEVEEIF